MLQAPVFDGLVFDLLPFQQDGLAAPEVGRRPTRFKTVCSDSARKNIARYAQQFSETANPGGFALGVGNLRRYRAQVNNDGGAVPIWKLPEPVVI